MNWRQGIFRIWLVLTLLWVVGLSGIVWSSIPDVLPSLPTQPTAEELRFDSGEMTLQEKIEAAENRRKLERKIEEVRRKLKRPAPAPLDRPLSAKWDVFWDSLFAGVWRILVVPPVVVFVGGWLVLWALRGFRQGSR